MIPRELTEGVKKMLEAGAPREVIRGFLFERGWSSAEADEVFAQIDKEIEARRERERARQQEIIQRKEEILKREKVKAEEEKLHAAEMIRLQKEEEKKREVELKTKERKEPQKAEKSRGLTVTPQTFPQVRRDSLITTPQKRSEDKKTVYPERAKVTIAQPGPHPRSAPPAMVPGTHPATPRITLQKERISKDTRISKVPKEKTIPEAPEIIAERFGMDSISSPLVLASSAFSLVRARFWNLFFFTFMVSVIYLIAYVILWYVITAERLRDFFVLLTTYNGGHQLVMIFSVLALLFIGFITISFLLWLPASYILALSGRKTTFRDLFIFGFRNGFSLAISLLFLVLFITSGTLYFVIPGFLFSVWFVFAPLIAVIEKTTPFQALLVSRELVRSHFMQVLWREIFLIIPTALFAIPLLLLVSPLSLLDSFGVGLGLIVLLFVAFALLLLMFAYLLFFFAYHVAFYKEMRVRAHSVTLSSRFAKLLPFILVIPLIISLALAFYAASLM